MARLTGIEGRNDVTAKSAVTVSPGPKAVQRDGDARTEEIPSSPTRDTFENKSAHDHTDLSTD